MVVQLKSQLWSNFNQKNVKHNDQKIIDFNLFDLLLVYEAFMKFFYEEDAQDFLDLESLDCRSKCEQEDGIRNCDCSYMASQFVTNVIWRCHSQEC